MESIMTVELYSEQREPIERGAERGAMISTRWKDAYPTLAEALEAASGMAPGDYYVQAANGDDLARLTIYGPPVPEAEEPAILPIRPVWVDRIVMGLAGGTN